MIKRIGCAICIFIVLICGICAIRGQVCGLKNQEVYNNQQIANEYSGSINIIEKYLTLYMIFFIMGLYIKKKKYSGTVNNDMVKCS